ncbi:Na+/H+ antiporter subunit E [Deinococcus sonorensis]|uniref:Na+/H+ antiporter subunit E n=2 Tax=Deinococcus sonorensis TaxID=309891 RepID=A0AAU7U4K9_9DEIO
MPKEGQGRFWIAELAVLFGVWLLFVSKLERAESLIGLVAAGLAALMTAVVRGTDLARFCPPVRTLLQLWRVPLAVVSDTFTVFRALFATLLGKPLPGRISSVRFDPGGDDARSAARRALAVGALTTAPNSIVIEIDRQRGLLMVHELVPADVASTLRALELQ